MKGEFWAEVEQAYFQVLDLAPDARAMFLNQTYSSRHDIRMEVESLLAHKDAAQNLTPVSVLDVAKQAFEDLEFESLIGKVVNDRYRIVSYIGSGGFADVYLAKHIFLHTQLALKTPKRRFREDPEYWQKFKAEARRAAVLRHENIVRLYDVVEEGDDIFAVMDHIEGETLEKRLARLGRPLTMEEFFPIATKCASALGAAHKERIVHLDVKPANIMLTNDEQVKVCDFGIARRLPSSATTETSEIAADRWQLAGTPAYMAPEVIFGVEFDERADLFSLGVVFYEMLAGYNPFNAGAPDPTFNRIRHDTPPPISKSNPKIDPRLEDLIFNLLAKEPDQRIPSAQDLLVRLNAMTRAFKRREYVVESIFEVFRESRIAQVAAVFVVLCTLAAAPVWLYRTELQSMMGFNPNSERPVVLVADFNNRTGNPFFDLTVRDLLTIGLQQSHFVEVFPRERVRQTLERMRRLPDTTLDLETCRQICAREGLSLLIMADIETQASGYRISAKIIDSKTGQTRGVVTAGLQRIQDLSLSLDRLTADLRSVLGESAAEIHANRKPLADVTTSSQPALEQFSQAMELKAQNLFADAAVLLRSSLELDPEFAMALGQLALVESTDRRVALEASAKAYALRDRVTERERNFIVATYHLFRQQHEDAVRFYHALVLLYPSELSARRLLAQTYALMGRYDDAVKAYQEVVRKDPESVEDKVMLAGYQTYAAQFDSAMRTIEDVRRVDPGNEHVYWVEGDLHMGRGDLLLARAALTHLANSKKFADYAALEITQVLIYSGQLQEAINQLELDMIRFQNSSDTIDFARHYWLSELYSLVGRTADAERQVRYLAARPALPPFIPQLRAAGLWSIQHQRPRLVENVLNGLKQIEREYPGKFVQGAIHQLEGERAASLGNVSVARERLQQAHELWPDPLTTQSLANALMLVGENEQARLLYDVLLERKGEILRWHPASLWVLAHLHAARLAAGTRQYPHARESYEKFIQVWGNSPELRDVVAQARMEMQRLPAK